MKSLLVVDDDTLFVDLLSEIMWGFNVLVVSSPTITDASHTLDLFSPDGVVVNAALQDARNLITDPRIQSSEPLILFADDDVVFDVPDNWTLLDRHQTRLGDFVGVATGLCSPLTHDAATALIRSVAPPLHNRN